MSEADYPRTTSEMDRWEKKRAKLYVSTAYDVQAFTKTEDLAGFLADMACDYDDRAGDMTNHDEATPDVWRAEAARHVAEWIVEMVRLYPEHAEAARQAACRNPEALKRTKDANA